MATFQAQVEGLTGLSISTSPTTGELTQFLLDGVIEVTNRIIEVSPSSVVQFQKDSGEQTANGYDLNGAKVITILREAGVDDDWRMCVPIPIGMQSRVSDADSIYFASKYNPAYTMLEEGRISIYPSPGSNPNTYRVFYVNHEPVSDGGALTHSESTIKYFPKGKVYAVVLYAACKSILNHLASGISLPTDPTLPTPPVMPDIAEIDIGSLGTAPTYTAPTVGGATEEITAAMDADSAGFGTDADFLNFSKWFSVAGDLLEDEEDSELAMAQLQKIQTYIQAYTAAMQNQLNVFNEKNAVYQSTTADAFKEADLEAQTDTILIQRYVSEVQSYQIEINAIIQDWTNKLNKAMQDYEWAKTRYIALKQDYDNVFVSAQRSKQAQPAQRPQ